MKCYLELSYVFLKVPQKPYVTWVAKSSSTQDDEVLLQYLKTFVATRYSALSFVDSQFHSLSSLAPICCTITIRTYSLETRAQPAVLRTYVENQAILELILLYRASKCKDCLWTHILTFL